MITKPAIRIGYQVCAKDASGELVYAVLNPLTYQIGFTPFVPPRPMPHCVAQHTLNSLRTSTLKWEMVRD